MLNPFPGPLVSVPVPTPVWTPALLPGIQAWWRAQPDLITVAGADVTSWGSLINGSSDNRSISFLAGNHAQYTAPDDFCEFTPNVYMQSLLPMIASLPLDMRSVWTTFSLTATNSMYRTIQSWDNGGTDIPFACGVDNTSKLFASNTVNIATGTTTLADDGTLYRAVFSMSADDGLIRVYLNTVLEATTTFVIGPSDRLLVGAHLLGIGFKGKLNELIVSRAVASAANIARYQTYSVNEFGP